ncbi:ATPase domain-containing protein [Halosolutus gelatinilyticus]|uniref:ATPase domain-containing protein n=1 Tax=Halosolutus gelatinilyticus TaxID=2931975 RepID=UPI001FF1D4BE|nr:ATPase domain-containing protein [Halosolutus gelatinilyticus]
MEDTESRLSEAVKGEDRLSTGVRGLDRILHGGLIPGRTYMVRGQPGTGKSVLGLHFLTDATTAGDNEALYINLEESEADIRENANSFGFDLDGIEFLDLSPDSEFFVNDLSYDIFTSDEVAEESITEKITERVTEVDPNIIFIDPLTQLRYLSSDDYQFRKQVLSFMQFLKEQETTVLFTSQDTESEPDDDLQFMSDGIIHLGRSSKGRTIEVPKFRGTDFESGEHSLTIEYGGLTVYPNLVPRQHEQKFDAETLSSGVPELDQLLDGGIERGTVSILTGPTGVGKTTTGIQFMKEAAGRGERSVIYSFEEGKGTILHRCESINIPIREMLDREALQIEEIEGLQLSSDEFAYRVRRQVEQEQAKIVMIDGVTGYQLALQGDDQNLTTELHSLCRYLKNMGVTVILVSETRDITGPFQVTAEGLSYLGDTILFLQHIEVDGQMHKAIGVLKKRTSDFERTMREFQITEYGVQIGDQLTELRGILSGTPEWDDSEQGNIGDN